MFELMRHLYMSPDDGANGGGSGDPPNNAETQIDWSKVDPSAIPEDVVKKSTAYTKVLNESVQRRQEITPLKKQVSDLTDALNKLQPEDNKEEKPETKTDDPALTEIKTLIQGLQDKFTSQETQRIQDWQKQAGEAVGLKNPEVMALLKGGNYAEVLANAEKLASDLGIPKPQKQSNSQIGNPNNQRSKALLEQVKSKMTGADGQESYNSDVHRSLGGGVLDYNTGE